VEAGGVFITGIRLGVKDEASRIVETALPGLLSEVMGVEVVDYQPPIPQNRECNLRACWPDPLPGRPWADILSPREYEVFATYTCRPRGRTITGILSVKESHLYRVPPRACDAWALVTLLAANGLNRLFPSHLESRLRSAVTDHNVDLSAQPHSQSGGCSL
jgi:hypothetical protein